MGHGKNNNLTSPQFKIQDHKKLEVQIKDYFKSLEVLAQVKVFSKDGKSHTYEMQVVDVKMPGIAGLSVFLGINRQTFIQYIKVRDNEGPDQAHIRHVALEMELHVKFHIDRLPESADEEFALGLRINDTYRKRKGDKDYFVPVKIWRDSLLALLTPQVGSNVVNLDDYRKGRGK